MAYLGGLLRIKSHFWAGFVLVSPLFVTVLPYLAFLLLFWLTWPFWVPFYRLALRRHGAPFQEGDVAQVLRGNHKGEVLRVYDVWTERDQVRLELGEEEKGEVTDVFSFLSVQKVAESEQHSRQVSSEVAGGASPDEPSA
jgi:hypothetical protein